MMFEGVYFVIVGSCERREGKEVIGQEKPHTSIAGAEDEQPAEYHQTSTDNQIHEVPWIVLEKTELKNK